MPLRINPNSSVRYKPDGRVCECGELLNYRNKQYCSIGCFYKYRYKGHIGYRALHRYIERKYGKPTKCLHCGSTEKLNWANKSGEYRRDFEDWLELCSSCHKKHDILHPAKVRLDRPDRWLGRERPKRSTKRAN